jgi:HAD superfamily hydrolase (TIGR01509 family)
MPCLKALLFDVDGTLADTERDGHRVAFNRAFQDAGLDWDWSVEIYGELLAVTGGKERIKYYLQRYRPDFKAPGDLDEFVAGLHKAKTQHYISLLEHAEIPLRPGVKRILDEARQAGFRLAIATTTTPVNVSALLTNTLGAESLDWFEVIAAGDIVPKKKPAPDIYEHAMQQMSLSANECIAFEDSENGIHASRGAGLKTIIAVNGYTHDHDFSGACLVVDCFGEPDKSSQVLAGDINGYDYVSIDAIKDVFTNCQNT